MGSFFNTSKTRLPERKNALPGRAELIEVPAHHAILGTPLAAPYPDHVEMVMFGMGCFWGAERIFWETPGVYSTAVGYSAGYTPNPTYEEVCTGRTAHNEVVRVVFDPKEVSFESLLQRFWEGHDPTQGMRQGNDVGTQYRSGIYVFSEVQRIAAELTRDLYQLTLVEAGYGEITTEIANAHAFYFAEEHHQQYLAKNPGGYCGLGGTGVSCPVGVSTGQQVS